MVPLLGSAQDLLLRSSVQAESPSTARGLRCGLRQLFPLLLSVGVTSDVNKLNCGFLPSSPLWEVPGVGGEVAAIFNLDRMIVF